MMWHILHSVEVAYLVDPVDIRRETSMETEELNQKAKYLPIDGGCEWKVLEQICEHFPHIFVAVFLNALLVEAIELVNLSN
jgi:hypothetical protein